MNLTIFGATGRTGEDWTSAYVELASRAGMRRLKLQPLSSRDIELLLGSMLELEPVSRHRLAERLHAEAGGNPFFSIELTATLVDEGLLCRLKTGPGGWTRLRQENPFPFRQPSGRSRRGVSTVSAPRHVPRSRRRRSWDALSIPRWCPPSRAWHPPPGRLRRRS